jgi:hypothetical protein
MWAMWYTSARCAAAHPLTAAGGIVVDAVPLSLSLR